MRSRSPAVALFLVLAMAATMTQPPGARSAPTPCTAQAGKVAAPGVVLLGGEVEVSLDLALQCAARPLPVDVVLVVDRSTSMLGPTLADAKLAALGFLDLVDYDLARVGLVSFAREATADARLGSGQRQLRSAVTRLVADGDTHIADGLREAGRMLDQAAPDAEAAQVVVLLTDGQDSVGAEAVRTQAALRRAAGVRLVTVALGLQADVALLREIASSPDDAWYVPRSRDLGPLYQTLAARLMDLRVRALEVRDELPGDMELVPGSVEPPAEAVGPTLVWRSGPVVGNGFRARYRLRPTRTGWQPTNVRAVAQFTDSQDQAGVVEFPVPTVEVVTVLPSPTPPPTATPSGPPSGTATPVGGATSPPPLVVTPRVAGFGRRTALTVPAYLPHVSARNCRQLRAPAEIVLVLDTSTTMAERSPDGRHKLDLALQAARAFVADLDPRLDRVAVVVFNASARVVTPLTLDRDAVLQALQAVSVSRGSRLDLGLEAARSALGADAVRPGAGPYVVLLTDGKPVGASEDEVRLAAVAVRAAGAQLFAVALGPDANVDLLREIALLPGHFVDAGAGERLEVVYRDLAATLRCR